MIHADVSNFCNLSGKFETSKSTSQWRVLTEEKLDNISPRLKFLRKLFRHFAQTTTGISKFKFLKKKFYKQCKFLQTGQEYLHNNRQISSIYCNLSCNCNPFGYMIVDSNSSHNSEDRTGIRIFHLRCSVTWGKPQDDQRSASCLGQFNPEERPPQ
jgi:hypothetical protein